MESLKKRPRVLMAVATLVVVASVSALAAGVTFGFFSSTPSAETNQFTAGTVTLSSNAAGACNVTAMAPGDSPTACTFQAAYSGSLDAYIALDVVIETQAGSGGTPLYNPAGSNGLTVSIADNQSTPVTYAVPTAAAACPSGAPSGSTCYELANELVGTSAFTNGFTVTFSTSVSLPSAAGNAYQGGAAQVVLTAHAVQSKNNTLACTSTPTAGQSCTPSGSFAWS